MGQSPTFLDFNPTTDQRVVDIKSKTDELIELVDKHANKNSGGQRRAALAKTHYENAAMWAVKACFSEE
jgi:hypothetical protein